MKGLLKYALLGSLVGVGLGTCFPLPADDDCFDGCRECSNRYFKNNLTGQEKCWVYFEPQAMYGRVVMPDGTDLDPGEGDFYWQTCPPNDCSLLCEWVPGMWIESSDFTSGRDCELQPPTPKWVCVTP